MEVIGVNPLPEFQDLLMGGFPDMGLKIYTPQEFQGIMGNLGMKLGVQEMKTLRLVCRGFNSGILHSTDFPVQVKGQLSKKWYKLSTSWINQSSIQWKYLELNKFCYNRSSRQFQQYWTHAVDRLTHLTLKDTSLECCDFAKILNEAANLECFILDGFRGRDLKYLHCDPMVRPNACTRTQSALRHIVFRNIKIMENCFLDYLVNRTGQIREIEIENCFAEVELEKPMLIIPPLAARFSQFLPKIIEFILHNQQTIEKMIIKNNGNQSQLLEGIARHRLNTEFQPVQVSLAFPSEEFDPTTSVRKPPLKQYPGTIKFITALSKIKNKSKTALQELELSFEGILTQEILESLVLPNCGQLKRLKLFFASSVPILAQQVQLAFLGQIDHLQTLNLEFQKEVSKEDRKQLCIPLGFPSAAQERVLNRVQTPVDTGFLHHLSPQLTEISLAGIIRTNAMLFEPGYIFMAGHQNLTKFELSGPYNHSQRILLTMIISHLSNLTSLTLKNCGLLDEFMVGLPHKRIKQLRGVLMNRELEQENIGLLLTRGRLTFKDLSQLKYLDLSGNAKLSDVTLFDVIRFDNLETLRLDNCDRISDNGLGFIGDNVPNLEIIHLENVRTNVSKIGLNSLIDKCRKLKKLYTTKVISNRIPEEQEAHDVIFHPNYDDIVDSSVRRIGNDKNCVCEAPEEPEVELENEDTADQLDTPEEAQVGTGVNGAAVAAATAVPSRGLIGQAFGWFGR